MLAGCLFLGGCSIGFSKASALQTTAKQLLTYCNLLDYLQNSLRYRRVSTKALLTDASHQPQFAGFKPLHRMLAVWNDTDPLSDAWQIACQGILLDSNQLLQRLGQILGAGTSLQQLDELTQLQRLVQQQCDQSQEQCKRDANLYQTLGVFGGLFCAILIL